MPKLALAAGALPDHPDRAAAPPRGATPADATIRAHLHAVWRYLRMHGATPHEADDLAQEAFVIALQKGAADLDPAATATFLRRTARFLFLRLRGSRRDTVQLADAVDALWAADCAADGGDGKLAALRECLGRLTERAQRAVALSYGLGAGDSASRRDIGAALGLAPDGVKTLLQRVRQQLRACIERSQP